MDRSLNVIMLSCSMKWHGGGSNSAWSARLSDEPFEKTELKRNVEVAQKKQLTQENKALRDYCDR